MSDIFLNDQPYVSGEVDPHEALRETLAFAVDDWSATRAMAWVYGIVMGWDDALAEVAEQHGWSEEAVRRLELLHDRFSGFPEQGDT